MNPNLDAEYLADFHCKWLPHAETLPHPWIPGSVHRTVYHVELQLLNHFRTTVAPLEMTNCSSIVFGSQTIMGSQLIMGSSKPVCLASHLFACFLGKPPLWTVGSWRKWPTDWMLPDPAGSEILHYANSGVLSAFRTDLRGAVRRWIYDHNKDNKE